MFERWRRWDVAIGASLGVAAAGVWIAEPILLVAAMAPIGFVAYSALTSAPQLDSALSCSRVVTPTRTYAGKRVRVTLTVRNHSTRLLPDVRLVDGVPAELAVIEGTPRAGVTLRGGETVEITYTLRARYGSFAFDPVTVQTQSLSADSTYTTTLDPDGDTAVRAMYDPETYPLAGQTLPFAGAIAADRGSDGMEFHGIRAYEPGDPASRINWRQYARERVLSTVDYRQQEAAEVLVVVDVRPSAAVAAAETEPTAIETSVSLARDVIDSLFADRNRVGVLALGIADTAIETDEFVETPASLTWVPPANTRRVRTRIEQLLDAATATVRPGSDHADREIEPPTPAELIERLNRRTQIILLSPLYDDYPLTLIQQLEATGHPVSVYTPGSQPRATVGGQVAIAQRRLRIAKLRARGTTVVDWQPTESPDIAVERHTTTAQNTPYAYE